MLHFKLSLFYLCIGLLSIPETLLANPKVAQIKHESEKLAKAMLNEDLQAIRAYVTPETMILPEYHEVLSRKTEIISYYEQYFSLSDTRRYAKEIIEIQQFGQYFLEIGTFEHEYKITGKEWLDYQGKYMTWWIKSAKGDLKILAHMWGTSSWVEPDYLNFVQVETEKSSPLKPTTDLELKILENINYTMEAVKAGDADKQLESYLDDAIYMTYYDPPFIGKREITNYFKGHYDPNSTMDSLTISPYRVIEMGDYSLQMGKYYVEWSDKGKAYFVKGNNLNFRKKMPDGSLKLYRQMVNHSMPPSLKSKF